METSKDSVSLSQLFDSHYWIQGMMEAEKCLSAALLSSVWR